MWLSQVTWSSSDRAGVQIHVSAYLSWIPSTCHAALVITCAVNILDQVLPSSLNLPAWHASAVIPVIYWTSWLQRNLQNTASFMRAPTPLDLVIPQILFPHSFLGKEPGTQEGLCYVPTLDPSRPVASQWTGSGKTLAPKER